MTIKKTNKFVEFFKRFGVYVGVGVVVVGVSLTFAITAIVNAGKGTVPVIIAICSANVKPNSD